MEQLDVLLFAGSLLAVAVWAALSIFILHVQRRRFAARAVRSAVASTLQHPDVGHFSFEERLARVAPLLDTASRELVMQAAADTETSDEVFDPLSLYLLHRWGVDILVRDAGSHKGSRGKWRRMAALRILCKLRDPRTLDLLTRAVDEIDPEVASVALSLLGSSNDPRAIDILIGGLKRQRHPPSRIAVQLERCRGPVADRLRPLLGDADPVVRFWAATLLGRYDNIPTLEEDLEPLADDVEPRVRKAAVETLGKIGGERAAAIAGRLIRDPAPFVRAQAARALGELDRTDRAADVASLLGDADWWVRLAARESLERMGSEVWPVLVRCLEDPDRFVRNGAAEVFQNLGILDNLIVMEAEADDPADARIAMLRRIAAAGEVRLTDALIDRAGPGVGPRIRRLLARIGLDHAGAARR